MRTQAMIPTTFSLILAILTSVAPAVLAQGSLTIEADDVECLPIGDNGVGWATVVNNLPDTTVHLNFRRLHDAVEDLYYVRMRPSGQDRYWGVFPKAEDRVLDRHDLIETRDEVQEEYRWAAWWREKEITETRDPNDPHDQAELDDDYLRERASLGKKLPRDWLATMDDPTFQDWLEQLENEPAEYFVSVHDAYGKQLARSPTRVTEVRENCRIELSPQERGVAENLTVGETAYWQRDEEVFHWLCDGIVTRIDPNNVLRGDGICRACVIAWWKKKAVLLSTAAIVPTTTVIVHKDPPAPVSQDCPN
ncbi:MAG: hypothetical protein AAF657_27195 [Acidobacteriota bacterium]